jgi:mono/diheme cytochrome c family protein
MTLFGSRSGRCSALLFVGSLLLAIGCDNVLVKRSAGEKLYRQKCASCHGLDAKGQTVRYMGSPRANLRDNDWKYGGGDSVAIQTVLLQGLVERHPASLGKLQTGEVKEIADWVLELRGESSR